eukprot:scaffold30213_cov57-Phaeocystis_antarctica.AAC.2
MTSSACTSATKSASPNGHVFGYGLTFSIVSYTASECVGCSGNAKSGMLGGLDASIRTWSRALRAEDGRSGTGGGERRPVVMRTIMAAQVTRQQRAATVAASGDLTARSRAQPMNVGSPFCSLRDNSRSQSRGQWTRATSRALRETRRERCMHVARSRTGARLQPQSRLGRQHPGPHRDALQRRRRLPSDHPGRDRLRRDHVCRRGRAGTAFPGQRNAHSIGHAAAAATAASRRSSHFLVIHASEVQARRHAGGPEAAGAARQRAPSHRAAHAHVPAAALRARARRAAPVGALPLARRYAPAAPGHRCLRRVPKAARAQRCGRGDDA